MASVEAVIVAMAGGSSGSFREQVGRGSGASGLGSRAEWAAACCAGIDRVSMACLLVDAGLGSPADRGMVLEVLDDAARELSLASVRGWPAGMATGLAYVALLELAPCTDGWSDQDRIAALARVGVRTSKAAWSQTWGARYQQVLGAAQRRVADAVAQIRQRAA